MGRFLLAVGARGRGVCFVDIGARARGCCFLASGVGGGGRGERMAAAGGFFSANC